MSATMAPEAPRGLAHANATRVAVAAGLCATAMLFASLASAYVVRRSFVDWQPASADWPPLLAGFALAASIAIEAASRARGRSRVLAFLGLTLASALYLSGALLVIASTAAKSGGLRSPFDAFVALLLGVHVVHALIGAAFALWVLRRASHASEAVLLVRVVTHFLTAFLLGVLLLLFGLR